MRAYAAPMEGLTGVVFRAVHRRFFPGVDKYFMPFLSPNQGHAMTKRDLRELLPPGGREPDAVPQLLTRSAEDFLWAAGELRAMGFPEVNLNLGCPSGTVTAKGKGSGLLRSPEELERLLDEIFSRAPLPVSIKTRVGFGGEEEFGRLLELFGRYPVAELAVHPRVRADFYRGGVRLSAFQLAVETCRLPLCYSGDLATPEDLRAFAGRFPGVGAVMVGRGLAGDPALIRRWRGGPGADRETLRAYHDALYAGYAAAFESRRNATLRMKEHWFYLIHLFEEGERHLKRLRKSKTPAEYEAAAGDIFQNLPLLAGSRAGWREAPPFAGPP